MVAAVAVRDAQKQGCASPQDIALHGWVDWAEWVEPVARSLAAVSSSALMDRLMRRYSGPVAPPEAFVVIMIDVGSAPDHDGASHAIRVATMVELRAHFPFVDAVAALTRTRYAVLARRHPGLSGTVDSLETRLRDDAPAIETVARVWCEELPDGGEEVPAFVRGLTLKPSPLHQAERGTLATGLPVEALAVHSTTGAPPPCSARRPSRPWGLRSAAAAIATATLMSSAGAAAAVGVASLRPVLGGGAHAGTGHASEGARGESPGAFPRDGMFDMFLPGLSPTLLEDLAVLMREREALGLGDPGSTGFGLVELAPDADADADAPAGPPTVPAAPTVPEVPSEPPPDLSPPTVPATPAPTQPGVPEAPEVPAAPDAPEPEGLIRGVLRGLLPQEPQSEPGAPTGHAILTPTTVPTP